MNVHSFHSSPVAVVSHLVNKNLSAAMGFHLLQCLVVLFLALVASHAEVDPEVYFKSLLPNTPIPKGIKDSLQNGISLHINHKGSNSHVMGKPKENFPGYSDAASDEQLTGLKTSKLFFLENDMHRGQKINLHISKDTTRTPAFIPRRVADSLHLTSNNLDNIFQAFSVNPSSIEAKLIKKTVIECEKASNKGEDQYCATSLESMVDYATSKLGKRVKPISTEVNGKESTLLLQEYKVEGVKKLAADNVVVCHQEYYAYAVHYCHKSSNINAYRVSLVGENNVRANAITICHEDTSSWNPKHLAFQVLNVKPGTVSVCHFLVEDEIAWVSY